MTTTTLSESEALFFLAALSQPRCGKALALHRNARSYQTFSHIPEEIWRYIFLEVAAVESENEARTARENAVRRLSVVCRSWRDICFNTSALWTRITFEDAKSSFGAQLEHLALSLNKSGSQSLDVCVAVTFPDNGNFLDMINCLRPHLHRVRVLNLASVYVLPPDSPRLDVCNWPELPLLEDLTLENMRFDVSWEIHALMRSSPALRTLKIGGISWVSPTVSTKAKITLPNLRSLVLDAYVLFAFLETPVHLPALEQLTLLNTEYGLAWGSVLGRTFWDTSPSKLTLSGAYPDRAVAEVLSKFRTITELTLYGCPTDIVRFLRDQDPAVIPALKHLTIDHCATSNLQVLSFLDDPITGETIAPGVMIHIRDCPFVSSEVGRKLHERGRVTFKHPTIKSKDLPHWLANDYKHFGLRFYPPKSRLRRAVLTGHY